MRRLLVFLLLVAPLACGGGGSLVSSGSDTTDVTDASNRSGSVQTLHLPGVTNDSLFPVRLGNKWVYELDIPNAGTATHTEVLTAAKPIGRDKSAVTLHASGTFESGTFPDFNLDLDYIFHVDGSVEVPQGGFDFLGLEAKTKGTEGGVLWPSRAELESGQSRSGRYEVETLGIKVPVEFVAKGGGKENVTVPAGTFEACQIMVIELHMKVMGREATSTYKTWFAPGVGMVKSETTSSDPAGGPPSTMTGVLVKYDVG